MNFFDLYYSFDSFFYARVFRDREERSVELGRYCPGESGLYRPRPATFILLHDMTEQPNFKCYTCKLEKAQCHYSIRSLQKGYYRCLECDRERSKKTRQKQKAKAQENPWLKKLQALYKNVDYPETRKLWNADVAKQVWLSYSKRCALSNEMLEEKDVSYVKINKDKDLEPTNAAIVNRFLASRTKRRDFVWDKEQRARIQDAMVEYNHSNC